jgi:membrane dipeptidase
MTPGRRITRREMLRTTAGALGGLAAVPMGLAAARMAATPAAAAPLINRGRYRLFASDATEYSARTLALMERTTVLDLLGVLSIDGRWQGWARDPASFTEEEYARYRDSGINVFHHAFGLGGPEAYDRALAYFATLNSLAAGADEYFMRIDRVHDLERVKASGRIGLLLGIQNADHFRRPDDVDFFFGLGQRISQLTYNSRNRIGNGATERRDEGISDFGISIIQRMDEVGMAIDVSHCGDRTTLDAFEISRKPVLITHSNCRALVPGHPRCKTDEAIRAMARTGGVMGITGVRNFVSPTEPTTVEHVIDHFDHVRDLVGIEHVGVGSDMDLDGYDALPDEVQVQLRAGYADTYSFRERIDIEGLDHPKRMFDLTEGLVRRGYADDEIELVLGGNFARALGEIWPGS